AEAQKLLREDLQRRKLEEEQRKRDAAAQLRAKERAREQERERELQEKAKKQRANANGATYSSSRSKPKKADYSFEDLQKIAQSNGSRSQNRTEDRDQNGDRQGSRLAAVERLKVNRGISPERPLTSQTFTGPKIIKRAPVKRGPMPRTSFPAYKSPGGSVNHVRDAGLKAIRDGPIPLNTKKRDLRTVEEMSAELREKDARRDERERKMKEIEEERERQRQHREKAIQAAKYSRALMGDNVNETERIFREVTGKKPKSDSRSRSRSPRRRGRSQSPAPRRRSRSPIRRKRSMSPVGKKRSYSPESRRRSASPRRRRSASPPVKRKMSRDLGTDSRMGKIKGSNGAARRRVSRSPSPRPSRKRAGSPRGNSRGGKGPFDEDLSVSSVIGALFGTRYRSRAVDEDLSDDMEARPDEVFREEARSARIAREEDEKEAELERAQAERARKRKLERERIRS
ncbi:hypothetical protein BGX21_004617, partial [Mortierella sp. AD011]